VGAKAFIKYESKYNSLDRAIDDTDVEVCNRVAEAKIVLNGKLMA